MDILIDKGYLILYDSLNTDQCNSYKKYIDDIFRETPDLDGLEIDGYERNKIINNELSLLITDIIRKRINNYNFSVSSYWYPTRYINGGGLSIHSDGSAYNELKSSSYTILIYLNNDFEGGRTVFVDDYDDDEIVKENSEYITPKKGMILLLNQNKLHFAEKVSNGVKYILRGDIFSDNKLNAFLT